MISLDVAITNKEAGGIDRVTAHVANEVTTSVFRLAYESYIATTCRVQRIARTNTDPIAMRGRPRIRLKTPGAGQFARIVGKRWDAELITDEVPVEWTTD